MNDVVTVYVVVVALIPSVDSRGRRGKIGREVRSGSILSLVNVNDVVMTVVE